MHRPPAGPGHRPAPLGPQGRSSLTSVNDAQEKAAQTPGPGPLNAPRAKDEAWFAAAELHKLELLLNVATLGYAALWLDIDSIVFRNPLPHLLALGADLALPDARCVARPDDAAPAERPAPRGAGVSLDQASGARPAAARPPRAAPCECSGRAVMGRFWHFFLGCALGAAQRALRRMHIGVPAEQAAAVAHMHRMCLQFLIRC
jgi:hypothetical protein